MLEDSPLRDTMVRAMHEEMWEKGLRTHRSAKFNVMYAGVVPESMAPERDDAIAIAVQQLELFGGNDGVLDAPRRTYPLSAEDLVSSEGRPVSPVPGVRADSAPFRVRAFALDTAAKVAAALAQSDQVALEACRARGWVYRAQEATLVPRPPAPAAPAFESFEQLAQLTRIATHLTA